MKKLPKWLVTMSMKEGRSWSNENAPALCLGTGELGFIEGAAFIYNKFRTAIDAEMAKQGVTNEETSGAKSETRSQDQANF